MAKMFSSILGAVLVFIVSPAAALNGVSFISSNGSDANPCTIAAPCFSLGNNGAITKTLPGGEIRCLDSGPFFGAQGIAQSVTIDCMETRAVIFSANAIALQVNGSGIVVTVRGLTIDLAGNASPDNVGIDFLNGAALIIDNCIIKNASGIGIKFRPLAAGSTLAVSDTSLIKNGSGSTGGGIVVSPQSGGNARVVLNRVTAESNVFGIVADGTGSAGGINMTISESVSSGNTQDGIIAVTPGGGAPIGVMVKNTKSANNSIGIRSIGPNVTVRIDGSSVIGNGAGLSFSGGSALLSYGNNNLDANGINGAFSGSAGLQ